MTTLGRGRVGHHRRGGGRGARRRRVRDLHRRAGRLQADPRIVPDARKLDGGLLRRDARDGGLGGAGAPAARGRVRAQPRRAHPLPVRVRGRPRYRCPLGGRNDGAPLITAVTHSTEEARVTLLGVPDRPGIAGQIFGALSEANVNVDMIVQNEPRPRARGPTSRSPSRARSPCGGRRARPDAGQMFAEVATDDEIGRVSIIGAGMKSHPASPPRCSHAGRREHQHRDDLDLADQDLVRDPGRAREQAVRALHAAFELGAATSSPSSRSGEAG